VEGVIDMTRLLPLIAEFDRENSGTRIRLTHEILGGCWDALLSGRAAIAIGAPGDPPPGGGFARQSMGQVRFVFAVAPHHPLAHMPEPISLKELRRHRMAVASDTSRELMARSSGVIFGQPTIAVPNLQTKLAAQEAGLGVGHLPITIAQAAQAAGRLLIKQTEEMDTPETIYTAWRADHEGMAFNWFREKLCSPTWRELLHPEH
jgi:DNA-binding transcriptional LysR family regulator